MQISTQPGSGSSGTGQQGDTEPSSAIEFLYFDIDKVPKETSLKSLRLRKLLD